MDISAGGCPSISIHPSKRSKTALDMMADQFPQASGVDPQGVVDLTYVKPVEAGR